MTPRRCLKRGQPLPDPPPGPGRPKLYCSPTCVQAAKRNRFRKQPFPRPCPHCGNPVENAHRRYCLTCNPPYTRIPPDPYCRQCGNPITGKRRHFCSTPCSRQWHRANTAGEAA